MCCVLVFPVLVFYFAQRWQVEIVFSVPKSLRVLGTQWKMLCAIMVSNHNISALQEMVASPNHKTLNLEKKSDKEGIKELNVQGTSVVTTRRSLGPSEHQRLKELGDTSAPHLSFLSAGE